MDDKEFDQFQKELVADPTTPVSRGTRELMTLFGGPIGQPKRPTRPARDPA